MQIRNLCSPSVTKELALRLMQRRMADAICTNARPYTRDMLDAIALRIEGDKHLTLTQIAYLHDIVESELDIMISLFGKEDDKTAIDKVEEMAGYLCIHRLYCD